MTSGKSHINVVVLGHEDTGKSTITGQLKLQYGEVDDWNEIQEEAHGENKDYAKFAWISDHLQYERQCDISTGVTVHELDTSNHNVTLTDVPGHRNYVKSMIAGTSGVECGILVVSAAEGEFENGCRLEGQTPEHALLAFTLGVKQLIVAVNKMDTCSWSESRFDEIVRNTKRLLLKIGYHADMTPFIPISAFEGENISAETSLPWYNGITLAGAIDDFEIRQRPAINTSFRLSIRDIIQVPGVGTVAMGRVGAETIYPGMRMSVFPTGDKFIVESVEKHNRQIDEGTFGDAVAFDPGVMLDLRRGYVISDSDSPATGCDSFIAQFLVYNHPGEIRNGYTPVVHCGTAQISCRFEILEKSQRRSGQFVEVNPQCIKNGEAATVRMFPLKPMCVERFQDSSVLGRIIVRDLGKTIGTGIIKAVQRS